MNDFQTHPFHTLTDAFDELERRADAAPARAAERPARHHTRPLLVAASVVAVVAVATTVAVAAQDGSAPARHPAGGPAVPTPSPSSSAVSASAVPSRSSTAVASATPSATTAGHSTIPDTPKELERLFTKVLHGLATYTVTSTGAAVIMSTPPSPSMTAPGSPLDSRVGTPIEIPSAPVPTGTEAAQTSGAAIVGLLTSAGVTGGYDIQIFQDSAGTKALCDDPDISTCHVRRLPDGSSLAAGSEPLTGTGVTYQAELVRADGITVLMHVSNDSDPKGGSTGTIRAAHPPLTIKQMTTIVTSPLW